MLASINSLLSFLGWADLKVKSIKLQRQIYCPEEKELTKAEYVRLVHTAKQKGNERLNLLIQTICGTGIRVSELQYITVEAVKCGEAVVSLKGKTRSVFIVSELQKKLLRYVAEQKITTGAIFITRSGKPMSRTNIWREMKNLCVQAGVNPQKCFLIICATCLHELSTVLKKTLPSSQTYSVTAVSTPHEFILSPPAMNTVSVWKTCG